MPEVKQILMDQPEHTRLRRLVGRSFTAQRMDELRPRFTSSDVVVAGVTIPAGSTVMLNLTAANRDPDRFLNAGALDVTRDASGHVAFGHGLHFCLGARLAQIEGEVALVRCWPSGPSSRSRWTRPSPSTGAACRSADCPGCRWSWARAPEEHDLIHIDT